MEKSLPQLWESVAHALKELPGTCLNSMVRLESVTKPLQILASSTRVSYKNASTYSHKIGLGMKFSDKPFANACEGLGFDPQYKTKQNKTDEQQPRP